MVFNLDLTLTINFPQTIFFPSPDLISNGRNLMKFNISIFVQRFLNAFYNFFRQHMTYLYFVILDEGNSKSCLRRKFSRVIGFSQSWNRVMQNLVLSPSILWNLELAMGGKVNFYYNFILFPCLPNLSVFYCMYRGKGETQD